MNTSHVLLVGNAEGPHGVRPQGSGPMAAAWRQELGRAFARGWFHGPMDAQTGADSGAGAASRMRAGLELSNPVPTGCPIADADRAMRVAGPHRPAQGPVPASSFAGVRSVPEGTAGDVVTHGLPAWGASLNARAPSEAETELAGHALSVPSRPTPNEHRDPVRIHVEHGEQGSTVWIGLDGDATFVGSRSQAIVAELARHVQVAQCRLAAVICNGTIVYGEAPALGTPSRKEAPWR